MRRFPVLLASATCSLLALTAVSASGTVSPGPSFGGAVTNLSGANEVPPADPDGAGQAAVSLFVSFNKVCYSVKVSNIATATAAHIHQGLAGATGPVVVDFLPPATGASGGCASPKPGAPLDTVQNIINHPEQYYVNVHNAVYPGGAVRGQLG